MITRFANSGEMADAGTKLVTIADINRMRIEAEVDEFDAGRVSLGQPVKITAEGYPGRTWAGKVEEIPDVVSEKNLNHFHEPLGANSLTWTTASSPLPSWA